MPDAQRAQVPPVRLNHVPGGHKELQFEDPSTENPFSQRRHCAELLPPRVARYVLMGHSKQELRLGLG